MLFDDKDLRVFDNPDSREYFKEILQSYYSQNYRAASVLLYSFVVYDLYNKLQIMAGEGDKNACSALKEINDLIDDKYTKYSEVENKVIKFFSDNCPLYFEKFNDDIEYLKKTRHKCAHFKVNDSSLYIPRDYQIRMLICSMFEHILSVKAPFIMDLFNLVKNDIEKYTNTIFAISNEGLDSGVKETITENYLKRMTYDSLKKSYQTFIKLLFVSNDADCIKNVFGLYAFVFSITDYAVKNGYSSLFSEDNIISIFSKIDPKELKQYPYRVRALHSLVLSFSVLHDTLKAKEELYEYIRESVLSSYNGLKYYGVFYPRNVDNVYLFFRNNSYVQKPEFIESTYNQIKDSNGFNMKEFLLIMVKAIPEYDGFHSADCVTTFFKKHLGEFTNVDDINEILKYYNNNNQCTRRGKHANDMQVVNAYIEQIKNLTNSEDNDSNSNLDINSLQ